MRRRWPAVLLLAAAAVATLLVVVGRGGSPESSASLEALADAATAGSAQAEREIERRQSEMGRVQDAFAQLRRRGWLKGKRIPDPRWSWMDRLSREQSRASDAQFSATAVDRALDALPLKKPPLDVRQWVTDDKQPDLVSSTAAQRARFYRLPPAGRLNRLRPRLAHRVYARVPAKRWNAMTVAQRTAAVRGFYKQAQRAFAARGIGDLVLVVSPLSDGVASLPALAVGRGGAVHLTALGRGPAGPRL